MATTKTLLHTKVTSTRIVSIRESCCPVLWTMANGTSHVCSKHVIQLSSSSFFCVPSHLRTVKLAKVPIMRTEVL